MSLTSNQESFLRKELEWWADAVAERSREQLTRRDIVASGDLLRGLAAQVVGNQAGELRFHTHGRFHDMGAKPGFTKGRYTGRADRQRQPRAPKPSLWYSRTKGGLIAQLANNVSNKYIKTIAFGGKEILQDGNTAN